MSKYRVAFYITNKTDEQSKKYNLDSQKSILHVWAEEMGWKWVKTYCEEISNKEPKKEKFQEMITDAKNGLFDGICITDTKLQNIPVKELLDVMNDLIKYGIKLHIYNLQHIDIYSDQGRFILSNLSTFNDFFKGQLATKIRAGIKKKMKKEWFGQAPYGYSIVSDIVGSRKKKYSPCRKSK